MHLEWSDRLHMARILTPPRSSNISGSNFSGADLHKTNFKNTVLTNSDLRGAILFDSKNLTCKQIQSAMIDKTTRLPDYIFITGNRDKNFHCKQKISK